MREIKFRFYWKCPTVGYTMIYTSLDELIGSLPHAISDGQVMQYTGLTDKNGKEIYEGDIIHFIDGNGLTEQLTTGVADVTWEEDGFYDCGDDFPFCYVVTIGEVIGNIYENPELLND